MSVIHHFNTNFLCSLKTFMSILLAIIPHEFIFYYTDYKLTLSKLELPILISKVKWCAFFWFLSVHKHVLFNSLLQLNIIIGSFQVNIIQIALYCIKSHDLDIDYLQLLILNIAIVFILLNYLPLNVIRCKTIIGQIATILMWLHDDSTFATCLTRHVAIIIA